MDELTTTPSMAEYYQMIKAEHEANNAWSAEQAQKAMDYQREMSNTAHQREVADLKAAGLNPVLSAGGAGATTGSGLAAQRSDENIQALYGLTKMAIESNMEQAKAMASTAKYSSGSGGFSSSYVLDSGSAKVSKYNHSMPGNSSSDDGEVTTKGLLSDLGESLYNNSDSVNPLFRSMLYTAAAFGKNTLGLNISTSAIDKALDKASGVLDPLNKAFGGNAWQVSPAGQVVNNLIKNNNSAKTVSSKSSVKSVASKVKSVATGKTVRKAAQNTAKLVSRIRASR